jgi:hypothetical protein
MRHLVVGLVAVMALSIGGCASERNKHMVMFANKIIEAITEE